MTELYSNDASTTLASDISSSGATSVTVAGGTAYGTGPGQFPTTGNFRIRVDDEYMLVTAVSHPTWTVTRGIEGSTATTHDHTTANVTQVLTRTSITLIPAYSQNQHSAADHSGSIFPSANQTLTGNLDAGSADTYTIGASTRWNIINAKTLRTEDVGGATPTGGSNGDMKAGSSAWWWKANGAWHSVTPGGGGGGGTGFGADYFMTWDGTTTNAVNGRNGNTDYTGSDFATVWNQMVADLGGRTSTTGSTTGGIVQILNISGGNDAIPVQSTLQVCDGMTILGTGYGKRGEPNNVQDTGSVVLKGTTPFTNDANLRSLEGVVMLNVTYTAPAVNVSSASWSSSGGGTATIVTSTPHGLTSSGTRDQVAISGITPSGYNASGIYGSASITVVNSTTFTYSLTSNPGSYVSGGQVQVLGTRENVSVERLAFLGNSAVDVLLLVTGTGNGNACRVQNCQFVGGNVNQVQLGQRELAGGSGDVIFIGNEFGLNDVSGRENAQLAVYAGDAMILYNNIASPRGSAIALIIATSAVPVFIAWCHIGGGGSSQPTVKIMGGQNVRFEDNYVDNITNTTHGGVWVVPTNASCNQLMIRNNYFNINGGCPWIHIDGSSSHNAQRISIVGNQSNGNASPLSPAIVKFSSWVAGTQVDIIGNIAFHTAALTTGAPTGQRGTWSGNVLGGVGVNGDEQQEWISFTGVGTNTTWTVTHHLYGAPTQAIIVPTNAAAATTGGSPAVGAYVSAKGTGTITITTPSVATPSWDIFLKTDTKT